MLLAHAIALAEARSHLAALADCARTAAAASAYEHVLIELDGIHADDVPALQEVMGTNRDLLLDRATSAIEDLAGHGPNDLQIELLLAQLDDARCLEEP